MNSSLQEEFNDIVEENVEEFGMSEDEAIADAYTQLKLRPYIQYVAQTAAEREQKLAMKQLCEDTSKFSDNLSEIYRTLRAVTNTRERDFLIFELLIQGGIGGAMHCAVVEESEMACDLVCLLCDSCDLAKSSVPAIALGVFAQFVRKLRRNASRLLPHAVKAVTSLIQGHEDNKQVLYDGGFNDVLHELLNDTPQEQIPTCAALVKEYCIETSLTEISNNSFTRCRKLGEDTCVVPTLITWLELTKDDMVLDALRLVCVNDLVCMLAIRQGALERVMSLFGVTKSSLALIRQLCLNDEAKRKVGLNSEFTLLLLTCLEDDEDGGVLQMALSILCAIELRQPVICARLAEQGVIPLYIHILTGTRCSKETYKLALMALRNLMSHPDSFEYRQVALQQYGAEAACRQVAILAPTLKVYVEDCLRDLGLTNFKV